MSFREPTEQERRAFRGAARTLAKLGAKGLWIYLAMDNLHLMCGPPHDDRHQPRQERIRESITIPRSGGGDW